MSDDRMSFVMALGPCSWSFRIASMTEISVLVVSSPQNAAQSFATNLRAGGGWLHAGQDVLEFGTLGLLQRRVDPVELRPFHLELIVHPTQ